MRGDFRRREVEDDQIRQPRLPRARGLAVKAKCDGLPAPAHFIFSESLFCARGAITEQHFEYFSVAICFGEKAYSSIPFET